MGLSYKKTTGRRPKTRPPKNHIANVSGGHRLVGGRLAVFKGHFGVEVFKITSEDPERIS